MIRLLLYESMSTMCYLASKYIFGICMASEFLIRWVHTLSNGTTYLKVVKPQLVEAVFIYSNSNFFTKIVVEAISCDTIQSKHSKTFHLTQ